MRGTEKKYSGQQKTAKRSRTRGIGISGALFTHTKGKLLSLFFNNIDRRYYLRDISNEVGISIGSVNPVLKELVHAGILEMQVEGKKKFYTANRFSPIFEELKGLVIKTVGVVEPVRHALEPLCDKINVAFIFGSVATGEDTGRSDIDLMVIGQLRPRDLSRVLYPIEKKIGREINPHVFSPDRFSKAFNENNHFLRSVVQTKLLFLIGDKDDLGRLAGKSLAREERNQQTGN